MDAIGTAGEQPSEVRLAKVQRQLAQIVAMEDEDVEGKCSEALSPTLVRLIRRHPAEPVEFRFGNNVISLIPADAVFPCDLWPARCATEPFAARKDCPRV